jgi:DNA-binding MarR family transcriptional regulator
MNCFAYFAADTLVMDRLPFTPEEQNGSADMLLVAATERVSEAMRVLLWDEAKEHGISPIQLRVLLFLHGHSEELATAGYLSREFNVTKATMSDVVKVLTEKKLIQKKENAADVRSQVLKLTAAGKKIAAATGQFAGKLLPYIESLDAKQKVMLKEVLLGMIFHLYKEEVITTQRMCFNCTHYSTQQGRPFCALLKIPLVKENLRLDCPEHVLNPEAGNK